MRVTGKSSSVGASPNTGGAKPASVAASPGVSSGPLAVNDAFSVSAPAQFIAVARARMARIPDIRMAKVEAIRAKLDSEGYHPDGEAVADGLVREHTPPRRDP
jgi:flagellar biosynthesis anti-sigma factor FlgM